MDKRPLILTVAYDPGGPFAGMIDDWAPRHRAYCDRWGYDMVAYRSSKEAGVFDRSPMWARIDIILRHLKSDEHSHVIWLDADAVIADVDVDLRTALPEWAWLGMTIHPYPGGEDVWHFQSGAMYIRACDEATAFFETVAALEGKPDDTGYAYANEQQAMHALLVYDADRWQKGFVTLPYHWNNTVHDQPYAPIIVAFHGNGAPGERREIMRQWGHQTRVNGRRM